MFFGLLCRTHILGTELWLLQYMWHCLLDTLGCRGLVLSDLVGRQAPTDSWRPRSLRCQFKCLQASKIHWEAVFSAWISPFLNAASPPGALLPPYPVGS